MIKPGSTVKIAKMPDWVSTLPEESRRVFAYCLGRTYCVEEIDENGLYVLNVSGDIDERFGGSMNDIRLESEYLEEDH